MVERAWFEQDWITGPEIYVDLRSGIDEATAAELYCELAAPVREVPDEEAIPDLELSVWTEENVSAPRRDACRGDAHAPRLH